MKIKFKQSGFSLSEVLIAVGILMVGLLLVAGTFPVGIHLTAVSTERTIAAAVADEAFAKIRLYGEELDFSGVTLTQADTTVCYDFNDVYLNYATSGNKIDSTEFEYPSANGSQIDKVYNWSSIYRFSNVDDAGQAQITVFVSRKIAPSLKYYGRDASTLELDTNPSAAVDRPLAVKMNRSGTINTREITLQNSDENYITDESIIVDNKTGNIYKIIELDIANNKAYLSEELRDTISDFWVVPPPVGGGKTPCVGVYQRLINF